MYLYLIIFYSLSYNTYAQKVSPTNGTIELRRDFNFNDYIKKNDYSNIILRNEIIFLSQGKKYETESSLIPKSKIDSVFYFIDKGNKEFYNNINESSNASVFYINAIKKAIKTENQSLICHSIRSKLWYDIWFSYGNFLDNEVYLSIYKKNIYSDSEKVIFTFFNELISLRKSKYKKKTNKELEHTNLPAFYKSWWLSELAIKHHIERHFKKSKNYFLKSINLLEKNNYFIYELRKSSIYQNLAKASLERNKLSKTAYYLNKAQLKLYYNKLFLQNKTYYLYRKAELFSKTKQWDSAYIYTIKYDSLKSLINQKKMIFQVQDLNKKYETEKKEKENIKLKNGLEREQRQKRRLWIGSIAILLITSLITYLIQKNTKRKQHIAEQDKELEKQKVSTLLKDQEINSINAMIEGQEKERQLIANDLHDDLGGLMATVKLHFNRLKEKPSDTLYEQTNSLINDAYSKIRSIAHVKNSGVIAKQGLLKAVQNMTIKISRASDIEIEIFDFGLDSRLENSLEITIFRMIQELTTNIIKHANATYASINLTNHEHSLNIMIEDNGKGFDSNKTAKNDGMGIYSIEKRVDHLEGTMTIESKPSQGTTIIIDIPL